MKRLFALVLLATLSAAPRAGLLDDDEARKAILELRTEVRTRDLEVRAREAESRAREAQALSQARGRELELSQRIQALSDQIGSLGIASANSSAKLRSDIGDQAKQIETLQSTLIDLNAALKGVRDENAKLRGLIEVAQNNAQMGSRTLKADLQKEFQLALQTELQANRQTLQTELQANRQKQQQLEQKQQQAEQKQQQVEQKQQQVEQKQQQLDQKQQDLELASDTRLKKLEPRTVSVDGKEALVDKTEENNFNAALNLFKAADYRGATRAFETFIVQYPQSGLQATALFWLANSQFAAKDARTALASFQGMMQKFPQHPRAADAHLTMGHCLDELGDKRRSIDQYNYVMSTFPGTPAAQVAQDSLPKPVPPKPPATPAPPVKKRT